MKCPTCGKELSLETTIPIKHGLRQHPAPCGAIFHFAGDVPYITVDVAGATMVVAITEAQEQAGCETGSDVYRAATRIARGG